MKNRTHTQKVGLFSKESSPGYSFYAYKLINTPTSGKRLAYWLTGICAAGFAALFLPWQQNIRAGGYVTALYPQERPQTVNAVIGGVIKRWHVREGQSVKKGDTLLIIEEIKDKYFDPEISLRLEEQVNAKGEAVKYIGKKVRSIDDHVRALEDGKTLSEQKMRNKILQARMKTAIDSAELAAVALDYEIAVERFKRYQAMYDSGLVSLTNFETRRLKVQESLAKVQAQRNKLMLAQNEQLNAHIELNGTIAEYDAKISKAYSEKNEAMYNQNDAKGSFAKLKNEAANVGIRNGFYVIRAPQNGRTIQALKAGPGEMLKQGDAVVTIMPDKHTQAVELYVYPRDVPLLSLGRKVRLEFDGWPALQFSGWPNVSIGTFGGVVSVIDYVNSKDGKYRVLIAEDPKDKAWPAELRIGSGVLGWAMLDEVRVWFEVWRQLNGFPPSLREKPNDIPTLQDKKDKKKSQVSETDDD